MAETIIAIATSVSAAIGGAAATITGSTAVGGVVANAVYGAVTWGFSLQGLITVGLAVSATRVPGPETGQQSMKQARPPRRRAYGRVRLGGYFMLWEAKANFFYDVLAFHDGLIDGIDAYYLHDDLVTIDGAGVVQEGADGRYSTGTVNIKTRLGLPTETAYSEIVTAIPALWTNDHRGDGIASLAIYGKHASLENYPRIFPNGEPQASVVFRAQKVYDPRDVAQDHEDPATWEWSDNPILCLLHYEWIELGRDWDRHFAPTIDAWETAADICDEMVSLDVGGSEKRYRLGGFYETTNAPAEVRGLMLAACDGWLGQRGDGAFVVYAGKYYAPTVTLGDDVIGDFSFQRYVEDESAVNELVIGYTSPEHKYTMVEADPWTDAADVASRGKTLAAPFNLPWVQSHTQARRLAKRNMARQIAPARGVCRTNLGGLAALGQRYIGLQIPEIAALADIVVEVSKVEIDLANLGLNFEWTAVDTTLDDWNEEADEGDEPAPVDPADPEAFDPPVITLADPFPESIGGTDGIRLSFVATGPDRDDLSWHYQVRVTGTTSWNRQEITDEDPAANFAGTSGFVPANTSIDVQLGYQTGGGVIQWSATTVVDTTTDDLVIDYDGGEA